MDNSSDTVSTFRRYKSKPNRVVRFIDLQTDKIDDARAALELTSVEITKRLNEEAGT